MPGQEDPLTLWRVDLHTLLTAAIPPFLHVTDGPILFSRRESSREVNKNRWCVDVREQRTGYLISTHNVGHATRELQQRQKVSGEFLRERETLLQALENVYFTPGNITTRSTSS